MADCGVGIIYVAAGFGFCAVVVYCGYWFGCFVVSWVLVVGCGRTGFGALIVRPVLGSLVWVELFLWVLLILLYLVVSWCLRGWICCNTGSADLAMFGGFAGFGPLVVVVGFWCCGDAGFVGFWWVLL